jgi:hypothetical protein
MRRAPTTDTIDTLVPIIPRDFLTHPTTARCSRNIENTDRVAVCATINSKERRDKVIEQTVGRISLEPHVTAAGWRQESADVVNRRE